MAIHHREPLKPREAEKLNLTEKVIAIRRVAKVVKGGRRFRFSVLVVVGDGAGHVGFGTGKAREVPDAIRKAIAQAKKNVYKISLAGNTIPFEVIGHFGASEVLLKPASPGTGIIAGSVVRAVMESLGVKDILTKSLGSNNPFNLVRATFDGLLQLRTWDEIMKLRGKINEVDKG